MFLPPDEDVTEVQPNRLRHWKYVQLLTQSFWKRWKNEYLSQLQFRRKWITPTKTLKINDLVISKEECTAPTKWKLGRIVEVHPGSDGIVRVVTVRLASGSIMKRPVVKLCPLPIENEITDVEN